MKYTKKKDYRFQQNDFVKLRSCWLYNLLYSTIYKQYVGQYCRSYFNYYLYTEIDTYRIIIKKLFDKLNI